eukprot:595088-Hanusia_phi.AAC.5
MKFRKASEEEKRQDTTRQDKTQLSKTRTRTGLGRILPASGSERRSRAKDRPDCRIARGRRGWSRTGCEPEPQPSLASGSLLKITLPHKSELRRAAPLHDGDQTCTREPQQALESTAVACIRVIGVETCLPAPTDSWANSRRSA